MIYVTLDPSLRDRAESLLAEFMNLVRVRIDAAERPPGGGRTEGMKLWDDTYGRVDVEGESYEDVFSKLSELVQDKQIVAATVVTVLAAELSRVQERPVTAVLDEVELKLGQLFRSE